MKNNETDYIYRILIKDLLLVLSIFNERQNVTLEEIRLRLCLNKRKKTKSTQLWSTARDIVTELKNLGYLNCGSLPSSSQKFEELKENKIELQKEGKVCIDIYNSDKARGYDLLLKKLFSKHLYIRKYYNVLCNNNLFIPIITSLGGHVSDKYNQQDILINDIRKNKFEKDLFLIKLEKWIRELKFIQIENIIKNISTKLDMLLIDCKNSAISEGAGEFSNKFLQKLNDIVIPVVMEEHDLSFDFTTHQNLRIWGRDLLLWNYSTTYPFVDATIVYKTADILTDATREIIEKIQYASSKEIELNFLERLYLTNEIMRKKLNTTYFSIWEFRSVFCYENKCQNKTFDRLLNKYNRNNDKYDISLELQRKYPPKGEDSIFINKLKMGSVRIIKK